MSAPENEQLFTNCDSFEQNYSCRGLCSRMRVYGVFILAASLSLALGASFCEPNAAWQSNWVEEFEGDALNTSSWSVVTGDWIGACRDALCTPDNVQVANGTLILTSKRESQGKVTVCP